ncbi:hypothetical protein TNCV_4829211 [Trichonephila clavipes]|nr:hypothetical protein TNCV_4829211 [Trichonephila clavipes]
MSRSGGQSEVRLPVFKSPRKLLVLIYRPTAVGMKGSVDFAQSGNRTWIYASEPRYATTRPVTLSYYISEKSMNKCNY